jgi:hypothetical protein
MAAGGIGVSLFEIAPNRNWPRKIYFEKASGFTRLQPVRARSSHPACHGAASRGMMAGVNKAQQIALGIGLAVFVVSLFFVPYKFTVSGSSILPDRTVSGRDAFWNNDGIVDVPAMLIDWTIIGVLTGGAILLLKKPKE